MASKPQRWHPLRQHPVDQTSVRTENLVGCVETNIVLGRKAVPGEQSSTSLQNAISYNSVFNASGPYSTTERPKLVPCGICWKQFEASRPYALLAHLKAHFDTERRFNHCYHCGINFISDAELRRHLSSAAQRSQCTFMFEHKEPCTGHHRPRPRGLRTEDEQRNDLLHQDDDSRFDFCYRLQNWELLQLQAFHKKRQPRSTDACSIYEAQPPNPILVMPRKKSVLNPWRCFNQVALEPRVLEDTHKAQARARPVKSIMQRDVLGVILLRAVCTGSFDLVVSLIGGEANVDISDVFGFGPCHYAAQYASCKVMRLLSQAGANLDQVDERGMSPLAHALRMGRVDVVECLLELGADLTFDHIKLHVIGGESQMAEILLSYWTRRGKDLEVLDVLLLTATRQRDRCMVRLLLSHGARSLACNHAGYTAMDIARGAGDVEILQLLYSFGPEPDHWCSTRDSLPLEASPFRHIKMIETLFAKGL